jgi:hypothetical protein
MQVVDSFNNQFKFYYYLSNLSSDIQQYLESNDIDIDYYCFYQHVINDVDYIITSNTTKRPDNGYRLITIKQIEYADNRIYKFSNILVVCHKNLRIEITDCIYNISDYITHLGIKIKQIKDYHSNHTILDYAYDYSQNLLEEQVTSVKYIHSKNHLPSLSLLKNLQTIIFDSKFNLLLPANLLPTSLRKIGFYCSYSMDLNASNLPKNIEIIKFNLCSNNNFTIKRIKNQISEEFHNM